MSDETTPVADGERSEMRQHADELMRDSGFLAEVVASEAEAARGRYHETDDSFPEPRKPSLPISATVRLADDLASTVLSLVDRRAISEASVHELLIRAMNKAEDYRAARSAEGR